MTVNIIKLSVGTESIEDLQAWQAHRFAVAKRMTGRGERFHATRMVPKRRDEVLDGGSIYWVIKGIIQARQRITGLEDGVRPDGTTCCLIHLDAALVPVRPTPKRPFQGWRYLTVDDAPPDLAGDSADDLSKMPQEMRRDLAELGLI